MMCTCLLEGLHLQRPFSVFLLFQIYSQALQWNVRKRLRIQSIELSLQEPTALSVQKTWLLLHSIRVVIKSRVQVKLYKMVRKSLPHCRWLARLREGEPAWLAGLALSCLVSS